MALPSNPRRMLKVAAAAEILQISAHTLNVWRHKGCGPAYLKISNRIFYQESELLAWLDDRRVDPSQRGK